MQVIFNTVSSNTRPEMAEDAHLPGSPGETLQEYKCLMQRCWHPDAHMRPHFKEVVATFQVGVDMYADWYCAASLMRALPAPTCPHAAKLEGGSRSVPGCAGSDVFGYIECLLTH